MAWTIVWFLVVKNSPSEDPKISEEERLYIENALENDAPKKKVFERLLSVTLLKAYDIQLRFSPTKPTINIVSVCFSRAGKPELISCL